MRSSHFTCEQALAVLVGGPDVFPSDLVGQARLHASRCPRCSSAYAAGLSPPVLNAFASLRPEPAISLRVGVFVVALTQLVFAVPWLFGRSFLPDTHVAVSHLTRDGAFGLIVASCALATVWRPRYVHVTMLIAPLVLVLQVVSGVVDEHDGFVTASFELAHLAVAVLVVGLFAIAANMARRATPRAKPSSRMLHSYPSLAHTERASQSPSHD